MTHEISACVYMHHAGTAIPACTWGPARLLHTFQRLPDLSFLLVCDPLLTLQTGGVHRKFGNPRSVGSCMTAIHIQLHHICMLESRSLRLLTAPRTHLFLYRYSLRNRALRLSMAAGHGMLACCYLPHITGAAGAGDWVIGGQL
jgi:hypothetical protein